MALNVAQRACSVSTLLTGHFRTPDYSGDGSLHILPSAERHCFLQSWKGCKVVQRTHRLKPRNFVSGRGGSILSNLTPLAVDEHQVRCKRCSEDCEPAICSGHTQDERVISGGQRRGKNGGRVFTPSRRELGLLAIPLVLIGTAAKAEEVSTAEAASTTTTEQNVAPTASEVTVAPEVKDELLEGGDINVFGGTPRTERADIGPEFRRYRAEDFSIYVPRSYENVTDVDLNPRSTLTMEQKAANRPYAARFTSPDQTAGVTVVIRDASTLRLSFLQTKDITDLGPLDKAAQLLLPPGAKILKSRVFEQEVDRGQELEKVVKSLPVDIDTKLVRTYYQYEFYARGQQVALSAAAQNGKVYVVGATVPTKMWKDQAKQLRTIARSFELR